MTTSISVSMPDMNIAELEKICKHFANTKAPKQILIEMSRETISFFIRNIPGVPGVSIGIHPMTVLAGSINVIENNEIPFGKFKETE